MSVNLDRAVRNLGRVLVLVLLLVLAWRAAGWIWHFAAPRPQPSVPDLRSVVNVANVARFPWFGAMAPSLVEAPVSDIRLIGLFAGGSRPAALLAISGQNAVAVAAGESPAPGLKLLTVADDHVIVQRNGASEKILLTGTTAAAQRNTSGRRGK